MQLCLNLLKKESHGSPGSDLSYDQVTYENHMELQGELFHVNIFGSNYFKSAILLEALAFDLFKAFCC